MSGTSEYTITCVAPPSSVMRVGLGARNYGFRRVSYGLPVPGVAYGKRLYVPWKFLRRRSAVLQNTYWFADARRTDLYHVWNGIVLNRAPWVTSFEAHLPRYDVKGAHWLNRMALERLASPACRRILALSEASARFIQWQNAEILPTVVPAKTEVFYGGVPVEAERVRVHEQRRFAERDALIMVFVGHLFFLKGGLPLLDAVDDLLREGFHVRLRLVSGLAPDAYGSCETMARREETMARIRKCPRIVWSEALNHDAVLDEMTRSDVALLPTLDDTLGWSVLEAMSIGLPVITTNVFALPEFVRDGHNGFTIKLPLAENRRWKGMLMPKGSSERHAARAEAYETIRHGIVAAVKAFMERPSLLQTMGENGLRIVREQFNPETQAARLRRVYEECL